jgi:hypothetical protein
MTLRTVADFQENPEMKARENARRAIEKGLDPPLVGGMLTSRVHSTALRWAQAATEKLSFFCREYVPSNLTEGSKTVVLTQFVSSLSRTVDSSVYVNLGNLLTSCNSDPWRFIDAVLNEAYPPPTATNRRAIYEAAFFISGPLPMSMTPEVWYQTFANALASIGLGDAFLTGEYSNSMELTLFREALADRLLASVLHHHPEIQAAAAAFLVHLRTAGVKLSVRDVLRLWREAGPPPGPKMGPQAQRAREHQPKDGATRSSQSDGTRSQPAASATKPPADPRACWTCGKMGHRQADCPETVHKPMLVETRSQKQLQARAASPSQQPTTAQTASMETPPPGAAGATTAALESSPPTEVPTAPIGAQDSPGQETDSEALKKPYKVPEKRKVNQLQLQLQLDDSACLLVLGLFDTGSESLSLVDEETAEKLGCTITTDDTPAAIITLQGAAFVLRNSCTLQLVVGGRTVKIPKVYVMEGLRKNHGFEVLLSNHAMHLIALEFGLEPFTRYTESGEVRFGSRAIFPAAVASPTQADLADQQHGVFLIKERLHRSTPTPQQPMLEIIRHPDGDDGSDEPQTGDPTFEDDQPVLDPYDIEGYNPNIDSLGELAFPVYLRDATGGGFTKEEYIKKMEEAGLQVIRAGTSSRQPRPWASSWTSSRPAIPPT